MDLYSVLRELADSWGLLALFSFFVGMAIWVFRPGSSALHDEAARLPLKDDMAPAMTCSNACPGCTCGSAALDLMARSVK